MPIVALAGFVLSGLAVFVGLGEWRHLPVAAACISLATIALCWDWKLALGAAVDVAIVWTKWPWRDLVGS